MRFALRLLLALSLAWCGLHLGEPAQAQAHGGATGVAQLLDADCGDADDAGQEQSPHLHHHHCPVASDPNKDTHANVRVDATALLFAQPALALASLTRAPPLHPPLA